MWTQDQWFSPRADDADGAGGAGVVEHAGEEAAAAAEDHAGAEDHALGGEHEVLDRRTPGDQFRGPEHRNSPSIRPAGIAHHPDAAGIDERLAARARGGEDRLDGVMIAFGGLLVEGHGGVDDGVGFGGGLFEDVAVIEGTADGDAAAGSKQGGFLFVDRARPETVWPARARRITDGGADIAGGAGNEDFHRAGDLSTKKCSARSGDLAAFPRGGLEFLVLGEEQAGNRQPQHHESRA
jgi:hypothetical protein